MKKKINFSEWLLLGLAGLIDFLSEVKDPLDIVKNYYETYYGYVPSRFQRQRLFYTIWRSLKEKKIKKMIREKKAYYSVSESFRERLKKKYPLLSLRNIKWDGKWRIVVFDIEESQRKTRDSLRNKLKLMGFGQLQKSVWLSPHNFLIEFKNFLNSYGLDKKVILIETENLFISDYLSLVYKLWPIKELNYQYKKILKEIEKINSLKKSPDRIKKLKDIKQKVIELYFKDPNLPKELLPRDWCGDRVKQLIKKLKVF